MSDETRSGLDALDRGPVASDATELEPASAAADPSDHPSVAALMETFGDAVLRHEVVSGDQHVVHVDADRNVEILRWLKEDPAQQYNFLADVTAVDYAGPLPLHVVYQLWSIPLKHALRVKCVLPKDSLEIDSVVPLWKAADWLEREVFDLFGVTFRGHPDLRRILMPDDYAEGHPLRKDFPLRGRFSRAEQTRRALAQDVDRFYIAEDRARGLEPQEVHFPEEGGPQAPADPAAGEG